ncbi:hypothetical protein BH10PSE7_BH10PSE7_09850 [soil metagenome]
MKGVTIRRLERGDDPRAAVALLTRFFAEEDFPTPPGLIAERTAAMLDIGVCGLFIAMEDEVAVGVATVSLDFGIEFGWSAEMGDLYVLPDWRGRGIANRLTGAIEAFLRDRGVAEYRVTVTPFGQESHDLKGYYAKLGFAGEGRLILTKVL